MSNKRLPETGTLVTVRITDDSHVEHAFHGTLIETKDLVAQSYTSGGTEFFNYNPVNEHTEPGTAWARIYSATGNVISRGPLPERSLDWYFSYHDFWVRLDAENVTVSKALKAGHAWVQANLSLDNRRTLLAEQVKALDPALGEAVDLLFDEIDDDAFERGREHEWRSVND